MAVSVDTVYQRVLAIANKEQRGYITPQEFNLLANQAQMEVFEQYFYDINQFNRTRGNNTEYSDPLNILEEKISLFKVSQSSFTLLDNIPGYSATIGSDVVTNGSFTSNVTSWALHVANTGTVTHDEASFSLKIQNNGDGATAGLIAAKQTLTTNANSLYRIRAKIDATSLTGDDHARIRFGEGSTGLSQIITAGTPQTSIEYYSPCETNSTDVYLIIKSSNLVDGTSFALFDDVVVEEVDSNRLSIDTSLFYRLGSVIYTNPTTKRIVEVQSVDTKEFLDINSGPLTKPSTMQPVYVRLSQNTLSLHPSEIANDTVFNFIRKPRRVNWAYNVVDEKAMFNSTNALNFELHESEEPNLVNRILELSGILLQKPELLNAAKDKVISEIQQEKA